MQVWAGDPPGGADIAQYLADLELLSDLDTHLREVAVHGHQALAVIDDHVVAVEEVTAHVHHATRERRLDRGTRWRSDVHATVRLARFAIEHAAQTERAGAPARHRLTQSKCGRSIRRESLERGAHLFGFAGHAGFVLGREIHLARGHLELLHRVLLGRHLESDLPLVRARLLHAYAIFARFGVERNADDRHPARRLACHQHGAAGIGDYRTFVRPAWQLERHHAARYGFDARGDE